MTIPVLTPPKELPITHVETLGDFRLKCLIYGHPGAGKTYLGCTLPRVLVLLTEGDVSKPTILAAQKALGVKIDIVEILHTSQLEFVFDYLKANPDKYDSVLLDSLSDINRMKMIEVLGASVAKRAEHDPDILEIDDWNRLDSWTRRTVRDFRDLPMHVVMTARTSETERMTARRKTEVAAARESGVLPELYPKALKLGIGALFNAVGYLGWLEDYDKRTRTRALVFGGDTKFLTKDLGGLLPEVIENPNLSEIINKLKEAA